MLPWPTYMFASQGSFSDFHIPGIDPNFIICFVLFCYIILMIFNVGLFFSLGVIDGDLELSFINSSQKYSVWDLLYEMWCRFKFSLWFVLESSNIGGHLKIIDFVFFSLVYQNFISECRSSVMEFRLHEFLFIGHIY